jgi:hypothetical protein
MARSRDHHAVSWRHVVALVAGVAMLAVAGTTRADVVRCEDAKSHITYSNGTCPEGTVKERPVSARSAVEVTGSGAGASAEQIGVQRSATATAANSATEAPREEARARVAYCDDLVRRIGFRQQDLLSTAGNERASAELALRRLQDEHQSNCERH